jgi:precorrin-3B synthase
MTVAAHLRKGWCPGALRPMRSGDGLLVRVRPRAGVFSLSALRAIATTAGRFGSGEIDLTNRANLQLRGVSDDTYEAALRSLDAAGLIDQSAASEAVRNVVVDPLSGIDPSLTNVREIAATFETVLGEDQRFWALPGKFGFSFSGSPAPRIGGRAADIMIASEGDHFLVCLDGAIEVVCGVCPNDVLAAAQHLALVFLELRENDSSLGRMRDAVSRLGAMTIFAMAGLRASGPPPVHPYAQLGHVGLLAREEEMFGVGIGLPFGRIVADQLGVLCDAAAAAGVTDVHTSPIRVLVFPTRDRKRGAAFLEVADKVGLITAASDARLAMDVCPGSPACRNSSTDTRGDAQRLVEDLDMRLSDYSLHVSGCEKGCARHAKADFTLVARNGHYDIIRNGCTGDPTATAGVAPDDIVKTISRFITESAS